ncbi:MAG: adenine-specific methyltransferase EcoRI family protein [Bacteroidales bacterium]|nr:adenine-specific methyltransferase EcoRI family protein [Bacteroidales bacterium]
MAKSKNQNLHAAKAAKKDEFYTRMEDICAELKHYKEHFRGKVVFCNCDDPYESNFFKYFALNFNALGLKKLICTCYGTKKDSQLELDFDDDKSRSSEISERVAYKIVLNEVKDLNGDGAEDLEDVKIFLQRHKPEILQGDGDFRSDECVELLKEADIVVTNPPFSLFREYIAQLVEYGKKFLIIGNQNAITFKEIFPLIKEGKIWLGFKFGGMSFNVPDYYGGGDVDENGRRWRSLGNICWYTNLDHNKRHEPLDLYKHYNPQNYPKYDNYDAINVDKVAEIPMDYDGVMGVPITFLDKYCPEQFEIVEFRKGVDGKDLVYSTLSTPPRRYSHTSEYSSVDVDTRNDKKRRRQDKWQDNIRKNTNPQNQIRQYENIFTDSLNKGLGRRLQRQQRRRSGRLRRKT